MPLFLLSLDLDTQPESRFRHRKQKRKSKSMRGNRASRIGSSAAFVFSADNSGWRAAS